MSLSSKFFVNSNLSQWTNRRFISISTIRANVNCNKKPKEEKKKPCLFPPTLMNLKCKTAIITGGTSGIGFAAAQEILCSGARRVAVIGIDPVQGKDATYCLNNAFGNKRACFYRASVASVEELDEAFSQASKDLKKVDIVVNSAGVFNGAEWEKEIVTNLVGTIRGTLLAYKHMSKAENGNGGVIINIAGNHALQPYPEAPTFCACQHGVLGLSRSFGDRYHFQKTGVRVITLCPGFTKSNLYSKLEEKCMTEAMGGELVFVVSKARKQSPSACGQAIVYLIKHAESGSVYSVEASTLYQVDLPPPTKIRKLIAQYIV